MRLFRFNRQFLISVQFPREGTARVTFLIPHPAVRRCVPGAWIKKEERKEKRFHF